MLSLNSSNGNGNRKSEDKANSNKGSDKSQDYQGKSDKSSDLSTTTTNSQVSIAGSVKTKWEDKEQTLNKNLPSSTQTKIKNIVDETKFKKSNSGKGKKLGLVR